MSGLPLPTSMDTTYVDSSTDPSVKLHQQHHDTIHGIVNNVAAVEHSVTRYGAVGDGIADDTVAVQAAIDAGGVTVFPTGTYLTGRLTLRHATVLRGVNSGTYNNTFTDAQRSRIRLKNAANDHLLYIPVTSNRVMISGLEIDGNKANQTTTGIHGIFFADDTAQNEAQAIIERVYIHDANGEGLRVGAWRQAVHVTDVISNFNGTHGMNIVGTDCIITRPICGDNAYSGVAVSGNVTMVTGGAIYNNQNGIVVAANIRRVLLTANGVDKNLRAGIVVSTGVAGLSILGALMTSNGRETNNLYPHIQVDSTTGLVSLIGCNFSNLEPGVTNSTSYAIGLAASATAKAVGNNYDGGSVGGYCNDTTRLLVA